jgi:hypothetical protein
MDKDVFDYVDDNDRPRSRRRSGLVWNILTVLVLLAAVVIGIVFLGVFLNPNIVYNPFPPPTMPVRMEMPTLTPTPRSVLPPTWTPTVTQPPTITPTPEPTKPPTPTPEGGAAQPEEGGGEEGGALLPPGGMPFVIQDGSPQYIPNIYHPDLGCYWMGVAGQVIGLNDAPITPGVLIKLGGVLSSELKDEVTISGFAKQYGEAGYEFKLADEPLASSQKLWLQLVDQADLPLSEKIYFDTFQDCQKNLIIIYFKQVK